MKNWDDVKKMPHPVIGGIDLSQPPAASAGYPLLPCPFCGADERSISLLEGSSFRWLKYECLVCGASCGEIRMTGDPEENKKLAAKEWNTRHSG